MELNKRMKQYEKSSRHTLPYRMPVIVRVDGRSFHSFTNLLDDPFCNDLADTMGYSAKKLAQDVSGAVFAYTQSDEINLLITPYTSLNFEPYFGNRVQKLTSTTASCVTAVFNQKWERLRPDYDNLAQFDARTFILPKEEVCNYFIWRQKDAKRNSIQTLGRKYFSHSEMQGLSNDEVQEKLWQEKNVNWADLSDRFKNGQAVYQQEQEEAVEVDGATKVVKRTPWTIDKSPPVFTSDRKYIDQFVYNSPNESNN